MEQQGWPGMPLWWFKSRRGFSPFAIEMVFPGHPWARQEIDSHLSWQCSLLQVNLQLHKIFLIIVEIWVSIVFFQDTIWPAYSCLLPLDFVVIFYMLSFSRSNKVLTNKILHGFVHVHCKVVFPPSFGNWLLLILCSFIFAK